MRPTHQTACFIVAAACLASTVSPALAAPAIKSISPPGLQIGGTTTIHIEGTGLLPDPQIVLCGPSGQQVVARAVIKQPGAKPNRIDIDVTLDDDEATGIHLLWVTNRDGISAATAVGVDRMPQLPLAERVESLPVALYGTLSGTAAARTTFRAVQGQRIVVEVEARRLGAAIMPMLHLYDAAGVQVAWARGDTALGDDARLETKAPADGAYTVELHDALYRARGTVGYRLKIGDLRFADLAFPLGVRRHTPASLELLGAGAEVAHVDWTADRLPGFWPSPMPPDGGFTGTPPRVVVSDLEEVVEQAVKSAEPPEFRPPVAINGRLLEPGEEDRYRVTVRGGMRLRFDVLADRLGSPLDGVLVIRNAKGKQLATNDDRANTSDPGLNFTVPGGTNAIDVAIRDLQGRGGRRYVYRLVVSPLAAPDFDLAYTVDRYNVPRDGASLLRVKATRRGYRGPIRLEFEGLPESVIADNTEIPAGTTEAIVTLRPAGSEAGAAVASLVGVGSGPAASVRRYGQGPANQVSETQPWLRNHLAVAVAPAGRIRIAWDMQNEKFGLPLGSQLPVEVRCDRAKGAQGPIRLTLVSTQAVPKKTVGRGILRRQVDDLERAIRFDKAMTIPPKSSRAKATILVPPQLPASSFDVAIRAELLSGDRKKVLASAVTPALRLPTSAPVSILLAGEARVQAVAGRGAAGRLAGTIKRREDFDEPVLVTLAGLPKGLAVPDVLVPAGEDDFDLPVAFPYGTPPGDLSGVTLVAKGQLQGRYDITSAPIGLALRVVGGDPPPTAGPLKRLFDDERGFAAQLHQGDGQIAIEATDRFSGSVALRVSPKQRQRAAVPEWGFHIKEKPGPGEFRYLRFAWKKDGGEDIQLRLAADGRFKVPDAAGPALAYAAGSSDDAVGGGAIRVAETLPTRWQLVTRDLYADFGEFSLTGVALGAADGEAALFDSIYLARDLADLDDSPRPILPEQPLAVFEDNQSLVDQLTEGQGRATLETGDVYSGRASLKVTPNRRGNQQVSRLGVRIRRFPGPGEYRYVQFAWKKKEGRLISLALDYSARPGAKMAKPASFRYEAGLRLVNPQEAISLDGVIPTDWVVTTRDLYTDFGEFTLSGLGLEPQDGEYALFDHVYLGRSPRDFELVAPAPVTEDPAPSSEETN